jgi:DNA-binding NarL/FixJ family response regulator
VDDHLVVRIGLRGLLETQADMEVIAEAAGGNAALREFAKHHPDVVLMDLRMPDLDGAQATAAIRAKFPAARILVLTTFDTDEDIYRALEAGAVGYLLKSTDSKALLATIRAVQAGAYQLPAEIARRLAERRAMPELSPREREVLALIVKGRSNKEIGADLGVAENTVKNHVKVILDKLGVADRTGAATTAIQRGLVRL